MKTVKSNREVIENYFHNFKNGAIDKVIQSFHPNCLIVSVREQENRPTTQLHGTYHGLEEVPQFITNILHTFTPKSFEVTTIAEGTQNEVFSMGSFVHHTNATGKSFESDWVQYCKIEDEKIIEYRFFEDSSAFDKATAID